jgi:hypothetical protein
MSKKKYSLVLTFLLVVLSFVAGFYMFFNKDQNMVASNNSLVSLQKPNNLNTSSSSSSVVQNTTVNVDNVQKIFSGKGFLYKNGLTFADTTGKPYLLLKLTTDNNQVLSISFKDFASELNKKLSNADFAFSDNSIVSNNQTLPARQPSDSSFEITKWEEKDNKINLSAKFSGKMKNTTDNKEVSIQNGLIQDLIVSIYTDKY